jgi:hypothetical protein
MPEASTSAAANGKAPAEPRNIGEAKLAVMRRVPYLLKRKPDSKDRGINYTYAAEADLIAHLRPVMLEYGIDVRPSTVHVELQEQYQTTRGASMNRVRIKQVFIFRHVPSGTEDPCEMLGEGADVGDKACGKAHTAALKYALRQYFCIETGDDPDRVSSEEQQRKPRASGFEIARKVVAEAGSLKRLEILRKAYHERGYSAEQLAELEKIRWDRARELARQKAAAEIAVEEAGEIPGEYEHAENSGEDVS